MKTIPVLLTVFLSAASAGFAADSVTNTPASTNASPRRAAFANNLQRIVRSPVVQADRHVTFSIQAPKAAEVSVVGQWPDGKSAMTRETNGLWSVTVGPIDSGVWEYSFLVDGVSMIDPYNPAIKPMREPRTSILHIPGQPASLYDLQDVPHGTVRMHTYTSKSLGKTRDLVVYTPPGYDQQTEAKYPTLYLQHGSGDNQATWTAHGKAHWIIDNLIAQGKARPMIVVMANGHTDSTNNSAAFESDLLQDIIPFVEANYRVKADPANRALVGLSMGGEQSLRIGLTHLDKFAWVGGFSSAVQAKSLGNSLDDSSAVKEKLKLLWIGVGKDDFLLKRNEEFTALLKEKNIPFEWNLTDGGHAWPVWRGYLSALAPKLFQ